MNAATPKTRLLARLPEWLRPAPNSMVAGLRRSGCSGKWQALNLLWSAWVFCTPLFAPAGAGFLWSKFLWSLALGYPVFLLLFALIHVRPYDETRYYSCAMLLLACVSMPFNPAAWSYGVFACVYVPYLGSIVHSSIRIALYELVMVVAAWWLGWPWAIQAVLVGVCSSAGFGALMGKINAAKNFAERMSMNEVRRLAVSAERERIGRDLHDLLGHTLSLITLKLELSRKLFDRDPGRARVELGEAEEVARHALAEVRAAVTGIRATGLAGELALAKLMLRTSGVALKVGTMPPLPDVVDDVLALALREGATNIARHAHATLARVSLTSTEGGVRLCIEDNGRGGVHAAGNGLKGMRERVRALGGTLQLDSPPDGGTRLSIDLPLPAKTDTPAVGLPAADALVSSRMQHATVNVRGASPRLAGQEDAA